MPLRLTTLSFVLLAMLCGTGCVRFETQTVYDVSWTLGESVTSSTGSVMLHRHTGTRGYRIDEFSNRRTDFSENTVREELIYSGRTGSTIHLAYREHAESWSTRYQGVEAIKVPDAAARPAFYQNLTYDLAISRIIRFKDLVLEVEGAGNSGVRFKVREANGPDGRPARARSTP